MKIIYLLLLSLYILRSQNLFVNNDGGGSKDIIFIALWADKEKLSHKADPARNKGVISGVAVVMAEIEHIEI